VLVPDFAGWKRASALKVADQAHMTQAPDWVCEILSPSTRKVDRRLKLGIYARDGVNHVWLIDPRKQTLEVLKLVEGVWLPILRLKDDDVVVAAPFEAVPFPLTRLWPEN
jgi:Uma2 family endonuclease